MGRADRGRRRCEMRLSASARGYNTQWQDLQRNHLKHHTYMRALWSACRDGRSYRTH